MALSLNTVFEVRNAGDNKNGGGFVTGAAGTDYSQQDAKNSGATDTSVTDGVTAGTTTVTSLTANFGTTIVGNIIYIEGGTGAITGAWYQVTARASSTSITVDRSTGLTAGTGATINIGGALQTIATMLSIFTVSGMKAYVKADGTYSIGTGLADAGGAGGFTAFSQVIGYTATRGDNGLVTIQASAAITLLTISASGHSWTNFTFDGNAGTGTNGVLISAAASNALRNFKVKNLSGYGVRLSNTGSTGQVTLSDGEVTGCGATAGIDVSGTNVQWLFERLYIHDNTVHGILSVFTAQQVLRDSIIETNTGTSDGIQTASPTLSASGNTFYANGRDGIRITSNGLSAGFNAALVDNILDSNVGSGIQFTGTGAASTLIAEGARNNAYRNNGAARTGFAAEPGAVTLTGDPFTNAAGGDFSLNATAGAGAACRAAGIPGAIIGSATTGYRDIGAAQHADPAAGGGLLTHPGMSGGMRG